MIKLKGWLAGRGNISTGGMKSKIMATSCMATFSEYWGHLGLGKDFLLFKEYLLAMKLELSLPSDQGPQNRSVDCLWNDDLRSGYHR